MKKNDLNIGQFIAIATMMEESRKAGARGVTSAKDAVIWKQSREILDSISEAVNEYADELRLQLECKMQEAAQPDNDGGLDYVTSIRFKGVVKEALSKFDLSN